MKIVNAERRLPQGYDRKWHTFTDCKRCAVFSCAGTFWATIRVNWTGSSFCCLYHILWMMAAPLTLPMLLRWAQILAATEHATIKHQSNKHSRVQFPACLLVTIYHTDQLGPVFLISSIWQNKRDYRKCVLVKISFNDLVMPPILFEECCWTLIVPHLGLAYDEAPRFPLEWRWKLWQYLPLLGCLADCSWLPASAPFFSRKLPLVLRKGVTG